MSRNLALAFTVNLMASIGFQMLSVAVPLELGEMGAAPFTMGSALSLATFAAVVSRIPAGRFLDGPCRKRLLECGLIAMALSSAVCFFVPTIASVLGTRLLCGIGWGLCTAASAAVASSSIPRGRKAEGMGWYLLGSSLAMAAGPALASAVSFRWSPFSAVLVSSAVFLAALPAVRAVRDDGGAAKPADRTPGSGLARERAPLLPSFQIMLANVGFASVAALLPAYTVEEGIGGLSVYYAAYALSSLVARPVAGMVVDRLGRGLPGSVSMALIVGALAVVSAAAGPGCLALAGVLAGVGVGGAMCALQAEAVCSAGASREGRAMSIYLTGLDVGICVGGALSGLVAGVVGYSAMYAMLASLPALSGLLFALPRYRRKSANPADGRG